MNENPQAAHPYLIIWAVVVITVICNFCETRSVETDATVTLKGMCNVLKPLILEVNP
jgi:hypothetical protein